MHSIKRSYQSPLSDLQLALLDHLFYQTAPLATLPWDIQISVPYAQWETQAELYEAVESLLSRELIDMEGNRIRMKPDGLAIWDQERTPVWDRWLHSDVVLDKQNQTEHWQLISHNQHRFLDFMEIGQRTGLLNSKPGEPVIEDTQAVHGLQTYRCRFTGKMTRGGINMTLHKSLQTWWSDISELQLFFSGE